ncbi:hypothetical protein L2X99_06860 [Microbacterium sp. KUDC0406]|uniref:hypothetical protein n=1 Tax=Microbacterium sp. KUDC0406 TaxID=2909588 RepID=UPI001F19C2D3|nr:hypothetical protein [Microbacterium sp. KUDC0406]UJP11253.1 hypothetical protein L2X99_06860 [Microbacterium sp. KUDC0406]
MRYLFSTGLFAAITAGISLLRGTRDAPITWRALLAWTSWAITLAFAIGAFVDMRRDERGVAVAIDSPIAPVQAKRAKKQAKQVEKAEKKTSKGR